MRQSKRVLLPPMQSPNHHYNIVYAKNMSKLYTVMGIQRIVDHEDKNGTSKDNIPNEITSCDNFI